MQRSLQTILAYRLYKFQIKNHRLLRKQVFPATMNCKLQDSSRVAKFWRVLTNHLKKQIRQVKCFLFVAG